MISFEKHNMIIDSVSSTSTYSCGQKNNLFFAVRSNIGNKDAPFTASSPARLTGYSDVVI